MTDSEDLRAKTLHVLNAFRRNMYDSDDEAVDNIEALFTQALTKERQRILAALPKKRKVYSNMETGAPIGEDAYVDYGFNDAIDQANKVIDTHLEALK